MLPPPDGKKEVTAAVIEVSSIVILLVMRRSALEMIASEILVSLELQPRNTIKGQWPYRPAAMGVIKEHQLSIMFPDFI